MIGKLLFAGAVTALVGYGYPLWNEHAPTACQAVESRFFTMALPPSHPARLLELAVARSYLEPLSHGRVAAAEAKQRYPALPAEVGCSVGYWASLLDPRVERAVRTAMR